MQKGPFQQEKEAASVAAGLLGLEVSDSLKKHVVSSSIAVERFRAAHCVHSGLFPGDVEACRLHLTISRAMFSDDPVLEVVSLQGKMGPWKFHLCKAWIEVRPRSLRSRRLSDEDTATRTAVLARILQTAAKRCASEDFTKWVENVGRHNQYHAGFVQMLLRLNLLVHASSTQHSKPSFCGRLRSSQQYYAVESQVSRPQQPLQELCAWAD
jgi:hypothetical protein